MTDNSGNKENGEQNNGKILEIVVTGFVAIVLIGLMIKIVFF